MGRNGGWLLHLSKRAGEWAGSDESCRNASRKTGQLGTESSHVGATSGQASPGQSEVVPVDVSRTGDVRCVTWSAPGALTRETITWGIVGVPGVALRPPSQGQASGGPLAVYHPCTGDRLGRQVAGWSIS